MTDHMQHNKTAVALGFFDGLHTGHMHVLCRTAEEKENGLTPTVLLFDEHPAAVLTGSAPQQILPNTIRNGILDDMGIARQVVSFRTLQSLTPEEFVRTILCGTLRAGFVACGFNYRFGIHGTGTAQTLQALCAQQNIRCAIVGETAYNGSPVSSTRIRQALAQGNAAAAAAMLGRPFTYDFEVMDGDKRGRLLGTPTINQYFPAGFMVPAFGVYASFVQLDGCIHPAVTDIGMRPTFNGTAPRSETWIMDYAGDLYGQHIRVQLLEYLRPEVRFPDADALRAQIHRDAATSRETLNKYLKK